MLRLFRLIFSVLLLLLTLLVGMDLHVRNPQPVAVNYFGGSIELTVSMLIAATLLIGAVLGMVAALITWKLNTPRRFPALLLEPEPETGTRPRPKPAKERG
jgi:uncharacterized membrane protein YciS (DUF1049 family)